MCLSFLDWAGFILAIAVVLLVSRKSLPLGLSLGALTLGIFTLSPLKILNEILNTLCNPSVLLLALAVAIIPVIGSVIKEGGEIDWLLNNLRIGKKGFLALTPALLGMLPMPGGALLSAPLIEATGDSPDNNTKVAINVWFRHIFILIYPLSPALIAGTEIVGLSVYDVIPWLLPEFALAALIGYIFFLRKVRGNIKYRGSFSLKGLVIPLTVVLTAPLVDLSLRYIVNLHPKELATVIGVSLSLFLSIFFSSKKLDIKRIIIASRPWNFAFIIIGMFFFLHIFIASDISTKIASLSISGPLLCVITGVFLGMATGRVQLPLSIILPIYLAIHRSISPLVFSITYFSIFWGYIFSPVHPCVVVTLEYFRENLRDFYKSMASPSAIVFFIILIASFFIL